MRFRGLNPVYKNYESNYSQGYAEDGTLATYGGVARKTILLLMLTGFVAFYVATLPSVTFTAGYLIGGMIVSPIIAYIMVILAHRNAQLAFIYTILYALFEGVFVGLISLMVSLYTPGPVVLYALTGTFGTVFVMLLVYSSGLIKIGESFRGFLYTAFGTLMLLVIIYIVGSLLGLFTAIGLFSFYGVIIVFSIFVSTLYLLHDFNTVHNMVNAGVDKQYEWSLSLGIIVVIVWLYVDILRLLAIIMNRRN